MGAPNLGLNSLSRAFNIHPLCTAVLAILAIAALGGVRVWAEEDEYGARAPFPAGPLRQIDDALKPYGIRPSLSYVGEVFGNASGGIRRGTVYGGHLDVGIDADLGKLFGWSDTKFHVNVINSHGDGLSREYLGNLLTASNFEALNHTRLYELWIEKTFGNVALRFGQFGADIDFDNSKYAGSLLNAAFGWPPISFVNLAGRRAGLSAERPRRPRQS